MGLSRHLVAAATARPHCYLVEAPGGARVRMAVEAALDQRGWDTSESPAGADALLVAGTLPAALGDAADLLWSQLPGPRARHAVPTVAAVPAALDAVRARLRDSRAQHRDARERPTDAVGPWLPPDTAIPLAGGADDRDGLEMDVLVHPLGPLLDRWPGGLELRTTLHGDVVASAVERWWGGPDTGPGLLPGPVAAWDAVATTLSLASDQPGARAARRLRATPPEDAAPGAAGRVRRRLRRLGRCSVLPDTVVATLLALTDPAASGHGGAPGVDLPALVAGHDLADVRLLVAAHAPALPRQEQAAPHA